MIVSNLTLTEERIIKFIEKTNKPDALSIIQSVGSNINTEDIDVVRAINSLQKRCKIIKVKQALSCHYEVISNI